MNGDNRPKSHQSSAREREDLGAAGSTPSLADQRAFYDRRWADSHFANRLKLLRCSAILEAMSSLGLVEPRIVELGCGTGWLTSILGVFGPATGVDFSAEAIRKASVKYPSVRFVCADIQTWEAEEKHHLVVSHEVIEHLQDQPLHVRRIVEALNDPGFLILTTPNGSTFKSMSDEQRTRWSQQPFEKRLTRKELLALLQEEGLQVLKLSTVILGYGRSPLRRLAGSRRIRRAMQAIGLLPSYERLCCQAGLGLHIVCVARTSGPRF